MSVSKLSDETYEELMARLVAEGELTDPSLSPVARYEAEFGDIPLDTKFLDFDLMQYRMEIANDPANRAECLAFPYFQDLFDEDGELKTLARL